MFNEFRSPLVAFLTSFVGVTVGALLKILHLPGGSFLIGTMLMAQAISIIWMVVLLVRKRK